MRWLVTSAILKRTRKETTLKTLITFWTSLSGPVHTKTIVNANASKRKLFYAFRPSVHTKTMKTLSKVDKFENAVYASSCGRP